MMHESRGWVEEVCVIYDGPGDEGKGLDAIQQAETFLNHFSNLLNAHPDINEFNLTYSSNGNQTQAFEAHERNPDQHKLNIHGKNQAKVLTEMMKLLNDPNSPYKNLVGKVKFKPISTCITGSDHGTLVEPSVTKKDIFKIRHLLENKNKTNVVVFWQNQDTIAESKICAIGGGKVQLKDIEGGPARDKMIQDDLKALKKEFRAPQKKAKPYNTDTCNLISPKSEHNAEANNKKELDRLKENSGPKLLLEHEKKLQEYMDLLENYKPSKIFEDGESIRRKKIASDLRENLTNCRTQQYLDFILKQAERSYQSLESTNSKLAPILRAMQYDLKTANHHNENSESETDFRDNYEGKDGAIDNFRSNQHAILKEYKDTHKNTTDKKSWKAKLGLFKIDADKDRHIKYANILLDKLKQCKTPDDLLSIQSEALFMRAVLVANHNTHTGLIKILNNLAIAADKSLSNVEVKTYDNYISKNKSDNTNEMRPKTPSK